MKTSIIKKFIEDEYGSDGVKKDITDRSYFINTRYVPATLNCSPTIEIINENNINHRYNYKYIYGFVDDPKSNNLECDYILVVKERGKFSDSAYDTREMYSFYLYDNCILSIIDEHNVNEIINDYIFGFNGKNADNGKYNKSHKLIYNVNHKMIDRKYMESVNNTILKCNIISYSYVLYYINKLDKSEIIVEGDVLNGDEIINKTLTLTQEKSLIPTEEKSLTLTPIFETLLWTDYYEREDGTMLILKQTTELDYDEITFEKIIDRKYIHSNQMTIPSMLEKTNVRLPASIHKRNRIYNYLYFILSRNLYVKDLLLLIIDCLLGIEVAKLKGIPLMNFFKDTSWSAFDDIHINSLNHYPLPLFDSDLPRKNVE